MAEFTQQFGDMLNEYLSERMMANTFEKRTYALQTIEKDDGWKGGTIPIPFEGAYASSLEYGQFASSSDISQYDYVRGEVSTYRELTGSMKFNFTDLYQHEGKIPEDTFLRILPGQLNGFIDTYRRALSLNILQGPVHGKLKANGTALGVVELDRIDRFSRGQKVLLRASGSTSGGGTNYYITEINVNAKQLTLSATRGGSAADVSAFVTGDFVMLPSKNTGANTDYFADLKNGLLSAAEGGSSTLYGQTKTAYPYLQAWNRKGNGGVDTLGRADLGMNSQNILEKIYDVYVEMRQHTSAMPGEVWMSYKHWSNVLKALQAEYGPFRTKEGSRKAVQYGWDEVVIYGIKGSLKLVAIQEMPDDLIYLVDPSAMKFFSNGLIKQVTSPDGNKFTWERATTGHTFIVDWVVYGEFVLLAPQKCGIIHGISY